MVKRNPRRPSSANPTARPRRIAGSAGPALPEATETPTAEQTETPVEPEPELVQPDPDPEPEPELVQPDPEPDLDDASDESDDDAGFVGSPRTTRILLIAIVAMAVLALAGGVFLLVNDDDDDDDPGSAIDSGTAIAADDATPVRISAKDAQVAVAAAAEATRTIVTTSYQDYDEQVEESAELMTPAFAEEYRQTAEDVEDAIIASKTEVDVEIVAQGVVRADQEQVQALVFLNQLVNKDGKDPVYTAYRALVTVVNTDRGWLVSDLETK